MTTFYKKKNLFLVGKSVLKLMVPILIDKVCSVKIYSFFKFTMKIGHFICYNLITNLTLDFFRNKGENLKATFAFAYKIVSEFTKNMIIILNLNYQIKFNFQSKLVALDWNH